jgi:hypothetical protein
MDALQIMVAAQSPMLDALAEGEVDPAQAALPEDMASAPLPAPVAEGEILDLATDEVDRRIFGALVSA